MRSVNEIVALRDNAMAMLKQRAWHGDGKGHRFADSRDGEPEARPCRPPPNWGRRRCRRK
jgi:hypothetical protein